MDEKNIINHQKQHIVPQVYLKRFACADNGNQIWVLDKNQNIFKSAIEKVAAEKDFYTLPENDDPYALENYYSRIIEPGMGTLLKNISQRAETVFTHDGQVILNPKEKPILAKFITEQLYRGKNSLKAIENKYEELMDGVIEDAQNIYGPITDKEKIKETLRRESTFKEIWSNVLTGRKENLLKTISNMLYVIYHLNGSRSFVTSMNPVMIIDSITKDTTPFKNGIAKPHTLIYYPLSSNLMLCLMHIKPFETLKDGSIHFLNDEEETRFIDFVNFKQYEQYSGYVFAKEEKELNNILNYSSK